MSTEGGDIDPQGGGDRNGSLLTESTSNWNLLKKKKKKTKAAFCGATVKLIRSNFNTFTHFIEFKTPVHRKPVYFNRSRIAPPPAGGATVNVEL